jgi:basic membrane protein A
MKKFKKSFSLLLILALSLFVLIGCGQSNEPSEEPSQEPEQVEQPADNNEPDLPKVALLLPGPINDGGWNAIAYNGLKLIEENYGVEIAYAEHVTTSDMEEMFHNYANQGFGLIIGHGFEFSDAADRVAPNFPDVKFVVTSSDITNGSNLAAIKVNTAEQGFLAGATAALLSETGTVAALGGMEIPPIVSCIGGFEAGAKYANPDVKVLTGFTGSMEDAAKMKEMMTTFIEQGADVGLANGDQSGLGGVEALVEAGKLAIGANYDQSDFSPERIPLSVGQSYPLALDYLYSLIINNEFKSNPYEMGVAAGAVSVIYNDAYELPGEVKAKLDEIINGITDGSIDVKALVEAN